MILLLTLVLVCHIPHALLPATVIREWNGFFLPPPFFFSVDTGRELYRNVYRVYTGQIIDFKKRKNSIGCREQTHTQFTINPRSDTDTKVPLTVVMLSGGATGHKNKKICPSRNAWIIQSEAATAFARQRPQKQHSSVSATLSPFISIKISASQVCR